MRVFKFARIFVISLVSAAAVSGISAIDGGRQRANQVALSLRWTRQMVTQAESLALAADAHGEREPVTWAARLLSQGTDSRIIFANKIQLPVPVKEPETYSLDSTTGIFDYVKVFDPQSGSGIRIRLYTTRTGIFGAKTLWQHDLTIAILFFAIYGFLFALAERKTAQGASSAGSPSEETRIEPTLQPPPPPPPLELNPLRAIIAEWAADAKKSLSNLGLQIRDLVRSAQQVSRNAHETREHVFALRSKLHQQIQTLHAQPKTKDELSLLAARVEKTLLRSPNQKPVDPETQELLKQLLSASLKRAEILAQTERQLEPIATDADMAYESLQSVRVATQEFSSHITNTTQKMLEQAKRLEELKKRA